MKRILALVLIFSFLPQSVSAATVIFLTGGTSFTIPSDWTTTNSIECIGSGGDGRLGSATQARGGGGGGAYAGVFNLSLSGSISYAIAAGGTFSTGTYFNGVSSTSASVSCQSGKNAAVLNGGAGGTTAGSIGTIKYAGGNGEGGSTGCSGSLEGGGGGGAGGPFGAGDAGSLSTGGLAGGGFGGSGNGASGFEWNYGSGAGSGAGGDGSFGGGGQAGFGGFYGGGGGGGGTNCLDGDAPGAGAQGIIVISYWPTLSSMINVLGGKTIIQGGRVRIY
ncbi:hypothetical protein K2X83_03095 [Patescibacteria group bacterium]|nr:hypothetical protein [Patescibacteria group bacterium]